jgi:predicted lysophospholipase L1 biosynthesis ABC-type transport system permease subunit
VVVALAIGQAIGAGMGLVLARTLSSELFGVTPTDPRTFIASLAALALLATLAAAAPLWRATRINATISLRSS